MNQPELLCPSCHERVYDDEKACPKCNANNPYFDADRLEEVMAKEKRFEEGA